MRLRKTTKFKSLTTKRPPIRTPVQIGGTCWFYTIINLINHSPVLRKQIAYSIFSQKQHVPRSGCLRQMYYKIFEKISKGTIDTNGLIKFMYRMSRSSIPTTYDKILNIGATDPESVRVLRRLLMSFGLPYNIISLKPKEGYELAGSLIAYNEHLVSGVLLNKKPYVINSLLGKKFIANWVSRRENNLGSMKKLNNAIINAGSGDRVVNQIKIFVKSDF